MERAFRATPQETGASWQFWADGALMLRLGKENMGMKFFLWCFALVVWRPNRVPSLPPPSRRTLLHRGPVAYHQPFIRVIISPRFIDRAVLLEFSISLPSSPLGLADPVFHLPCQQQSSSGSPPPLRPPPSAAGPTFLSAPLPPKRQQLGFGAQVKSGASFLLRSARRAETGRSRGTPASGGGGYARLRSL